MASAKSKKSTPAEIRALREANWKIARARWESEPDTSYGDIAGIVGVSKQAVSKRANDHKDPWQKKLTMSAIVERAHAAADQKTPEMPAQPSLDSVPVDGAGLDHTVNPGTQEQLGAAAEQAMVDDRARILTRHRTELVAARGILYESIKKKADAVLSRKVKQNIESMRLLQEAERKAWGIDSGEEKIVVIIDRGARQR